MCTRGPNGFLDSEVWPRSGYVSELDVYLDPAWSGEYEGALAGIDPNSILQLDATVFPLDDRIGTPHPPPLVRDRGGGAR